MAALRFLTGEEVEASKKRGRPNGWPARVSFDYATTAVGCDLNP